MVEFDRTDPGLVGVLRRVTRLIAPFLLLDAGEAPFPSALSPESALCLD